MLSLMLPTGVQLLDGAILSFGDDPARYILHYGKYKITNALGVAGKPCLSTTTTGWYVQPFGSGVAIPVTDDMLEMCKVYNTGAEITISGSVSGCNRPKPCVDAEERFTSADKYLLDRSWITVDTIAERDALPKTSILTGRIVEVNNASDDGDPMYFRWNYKTQKWDDIVFVHSDVAVDMKAIAEQLKLLQLIIFGTQELPDVPNNPGDGSTENPGDGGNPDNSEGVDPPEGSIPIVPVQPLPVRSMVKMMDEMYQNSIDLKECMDNLVEDFNGLYERVENLEKIHNYNPSIIDASLPIRYSNAPQMITPNDSVELLFDETALQACQIHDKIASVSTPVENIKVTGLCDGEVCKVTGCEVVTPRSLKFTIVVDSCQEGINHRENMVIHCQLIKKEGET